MISEINLNGALNNSSQVQTRNASETTGTAGIKNNTHEAKQENSAGNTAPAGGASAAVMKALEEANLPKTQKNIDIAGEMLQNRMSLGKDSLREMITQVNVFREADISTLLLMNKNGIPVNHFTAVQFQAYLNNEQQLTEQISEALDALNSFLSSEAEQGGNEANLRVLDMVAETSSELNAEMAEVMNDGTDIISQMNSAAAGDIMSGMKAGNSLNGEGSMLLDAGAQGFAATGLSGSSVIPEEALSNGINAGAAGMVFGTTNEIGTNVDGTGTDVFNGFGAEAGMMNESGIGNSRDGSALLNSGFETSPQTAQENKDTYMVSNLLTEEELQRFESIISEFNDRNESFGDKSVSEALTEIRNNILSASPEQLNEIFKSPEYQKLIQKAIANRLSIKPENLKDADALNDFYKATYMSLSKLKGVAAANEQLGKALEKPMDNFRFMDTLNNLFPYVQLPLNLHEGHTHGELYVFKNGRTRSQPGESQSVLLHLDMDHLGPTDVHMERKNGSLKLHFYAADDASLGVLQANIDSLVSILESKKYFVATEFEVREATDAVMAEVVSNLNNDAPEFKYSFDIRA